MQKYRRVQKTFKATVYIHIKNTVVCKTQRPYFCLFYILKSKQLSTNYLFFSVREIKTATLYTICNKSCHISLHFYKLSSITLIVFCDCLVRVIWLYSSAGGFKALGTTVRTQERLVCTNYINIITQSIIRLIFQ